MLLLQIHSLCLAKRQDWEVSILTVSSCMYIYRERERNRISTQAEICESAGSNYIIIVTRSNILCLSESACMHGWNSWRDISSKVTVWMSWILIHIKIKIQPWVKGQVLLNSIKYPRFILKFFFLDWSAVLERNTSWLLVPVKAAGGKFYLINCISFYSRQN